MATDGQGDVLFLEYVSTGADTPEFREWLEDDGQLKHSAQWVKGEGIQLRPPQTESSFRQIAISSRIVKLKKSVKSKQAEARLVLGRTYQDHGLVFDRGDGRPWDSSTISKAFRRLADRAGFPDLRLHENRSGTTWAQLDQDDARYVITRLARTPGSRS